jgi:hypothetical protein
MFLLTVFMRLLSIIYILGIKLILVFEVIFWSILVCILNDFDENLSQFLIFWACFNFY